MRAILCCLLAMAAFNLCLSADDKKDEKNDNQKLIGGRWGAKGKSTEPKVLYFNKEGKMNGEWWVGKPDSLKSDVFKFDGTYKIEDSKILVVIANKECKELKDTWTIHRLTDEDLWCTNEKGNRLTWVRRKVID